MAPERRDTLPTLVVYTPYVLIDQVEYTDTVPWPINSDGAGNRLDRIVDSHYGNDPANWGESDAGNFNFLPLSINELENAIYVSVFPNPAKDELNFVGEQSIGFVKLYSVDGRLVKSCQQQSKISKLLVDDLKAGVYFYEVGMGDRSIKGKVIIQ